MKIALILLFPFALGCASVFHESDRALVAQSIDGLKQAEEQLKPMGDAVAPVVAIILDVVRNLEVVAEIHGKPEAPEAGVYTPEQSAKYRDEAKADHPFDFGLWGALAGILFGATQFLKNTLPKLAPFLKTFIGVLAPGIAPALGLLAPLVFNSSSAEGATIGGATSLLISLANRTKIADLVGKGVRKILDTVKVERYLGPLMLDEKEKK